MLEHKVTERTEEVVRQKEEVERQSRKVVELYKNVTDSIRYAKRLQESILPPDRRIRELLPESFVLYRPKDIVIGDFYWFERVEDKVVFAAVDCTGHGVPGAFMSLVGHNGLNQAIKERGHTSPAAVLRDLNRIAFEALHKDRDQFLVRDGMDMALCALDRQDLTLDYAGANCPLYLVRERRADPVRARQDQRGRLRARRASLRRASDPAAARGRRLHVLRWIPRPVRWTARQEIPLPSLPRAADQHP